MAANGTKRDYYVVLSVERTATVEIITKRYKILAKEHHPDRNQGDETAATRFIEIQEAYEVLKDPSKREVYDRYRDSSLSRRMYTRSHVAVFNMPKSAASFVGPATTPASLTAQGVQYQFAHLFGDASVDWQSGFLRVGVIVPGEDTTGFRAAMLARFLDCANAAKAWEVGQVLMSVTDTFAAIWIHAGHELDGVFERFALLPPGVQLLRDLDAQQAPVRGDAEKGFTVNGPIALTYRFERRLDLFELPVPAA